MGALINLFLLNAASHISLEARDWGQLGVIFLIALVYTSIFIALGLLISARVNQPEISLTILSADLGGFCRLNSEHTRIDCQWSKTRAI